MSPCSNARWLLWESWYFLGNFFWRFAYLYVLVLFCQLAQHSVQLYPNEHHQTYHVEPGQKDYASP